RLDPESVDGAQRRYRQTRIVELMAAEQFWRPEIKQAALILIDQTPALDADMPLLAFAMKRRALTFRDLLDFGQCVGLLMRANHRNAGVDDPGLLGRVGVQR